MKKILFIEGYDTINYNKDTEDNISKLLSKYKITFFTYKNDENIYHILNRLQTLIENNFYKAIIGHSTGALLVKIITNRIKINNKTKIILTNGIVSDKHNLSLFLLGSMPHYITELVKIPRCFRVELFLLTYGYDKYLLNFIDPKQYNIDDASIIGDLLKIAKKYDFNHNTAYHVIYGKDDYRIEYTKNIIDQLFKNSNIHLYSLKSKHEPFNDYKNIQQKWKKIILNIIE